MPRTIDFTSLDLQDALDLAILIEEEARERYEDFAKQAGGRYEGDAGDIFKQMAVYEAKHERELIAKRKDLFGSAPVRVTADMFSDVEAPGLDKPRAFMSARKAMLVALESETKAWEFYDGAIKAVKDAKVRELFEELRDEEVLHQGTLKQYLAKTPEGPDVEDEGADEPPAL